MALAARLGAEIISADSAQVYRGMDIGTAKPTQAEQERVPHHLLDLVDPLQRFDVASFQKMADATAAAIRSRGRLPILVGGTGLYIRSVIERFSFEPAATDHQLREQLYQQAATKGSAELHRRLKEVDPVSAGKIHPNDVRRIVRALEVYMLTGHPISQRQTTSPESSPYDALVLELSLPRPLLYRRINRRTNAQIAQGWIEEVRKLLEKFPADAPGLQILGYKRLAQYVRDRQPSLEYTINLIKKETRQYARRQLTWLKKERKDVVLDVSGGITPAIVNTAEKIIKKRWQETLFIRRTPGHA